mmetsp:Transcript_89225/g.252414  ORF Transcript_89225/g.252414 Transcript_89225/m.252414 type:complete len:285 (-) Transcript_89225:1417-2271(-)
MKTTGRIKRLVGAHRRDAPALYDDDVVCAGQELHLMGHEDTRAASENTFGAKYLLEEVLGHVGIHSGQGVVEQVDPFRAVDRPGNGHACALAPAQVYAALANLCLVACGHRLQVLDDAARAEHLLVVLVLWVLPLRRKLHVLLQRGVHDPGLLRSICHLAGNGATGTLKHCRLAEPRSQQGALATAHRADHHGKAALNGLHMLYCQRPVHFECLPTLALDLYQRRRAHILPLLTMWPSFFRALALPFSLAAKTAAALTLALALTLAICSLLVGKRIAKLCTFDS